MAAIMMCSLIACELSSDGDGSKEKEGTDVQSGGGQTDDIGSLDEILKPEGWDENNYEMYIYDVWDEEFLPDVLPGPIEGVLPYMTEYKDYKHDVLNQNYSVGQIEYDSYEDYREYSVYFYATEEKLDEYLNTMIAAGFVGSTVTDREDRWWEFHFSHEDGWAAYVLFNTGDDKNGEYDGLASISLTDCLYERPASIAGIPLPQCGVVSFDHEYYCIQAYDDTGMIEPEFDLEKDALPADYYAAWFGYYGTVAQNAQDYASQLQGEGWSVMREENRENGDYYCRLSKDGTYCVVRYYISDSFIQLGFSNMEELLDY